MDECHRCSALAGSVEKGRHGPSLYTWGTWGSEGSGLGQVSRSKVVQSPSRVRLFATPWTAVCQASLSLTVSRSLPKFMFIVLVMLSGHLILWCPLLLLPSIFPRIRDFSNESSVCIRWTKYQSFSFSISPSSEYSGLVSLKTDWFDGLSEEQGKHWK